MGFPPLISDNPEPMFLTRQSFLTLAALFMFLTGLTAYSRKTHVQASNWHRRLGTRVLSLRANFGCLFSGKLQQWRMEVSIYMLLAHLDLPHGMLISHWGV